MVALMLVSGCGSDDRYAGLRRDEAAGESIRVVRQMREPAAVVDLWAPRKRIPIGTWRSRNSSGQSAWVTIFRLTGVVNDTDQACVWARREASHPTTFEEAPSVAWGIVGEAKHDRCAAEVRARGIAGREQTIGSEVSSPPVAEPEIVAPFGSWQASLPPAEYSGGSGMTLTAQELLLPKEGSSGHVRVRRFRDRRGDVQASLRSPSFHRARRALRRPRRNYRPAWLLRLLGPACRRQRF
jgi:hypothetical protein